METDHGKRSVPRCYGDEGMRSIGKTQQRCGNDILMEGWSTWSGSGGMMWAGVGHVHILDHEHDRDPVVWYKLLAGS